VVDVRLRGRLKALFDGDITLAAYHLALDAHPEVGNNALLAAALDLHVDEPFEVGFGCSYPEPVTADAFVARVRDVLSREPLAFLYGPREIRRVAIVSGGAASMLPQAAAAGYDLFLTGEPAEPTMMTARELGVHFVAGGHYATERLGVRALTERIASTSTCLAIHRARQPGLTRRPGGRSSAGRSPAPLRPDAARNARHRRVRHCALRSRAASVAVGGAERYSPDR
jgi:dinuclear metal center YbgI/SA1388 family protein